MNGIDVINLSSVLDRRTVIHRVYGYGALIQAFSPAERFMNHEPPFMIEESVLHRARELGQAAVFFPDQIDGEPLTMRLMCNRLRNKLGDGKLLYDTAWYLNQDFFTSLTPRKGWRLVTPEVLPNSLNEDYLGGTEEIVSYLIGDVYRNATLPPVFAEAVAEWDDLKHHLSSEWQKAARELAALKVNQLFRLNPVEELYLNIVNFTVNGGERLLETTYSWTNTLLSNGRFVRLGLCGSVGVSVDFDGPFDSHSIRGVRFCLPPIPAT